MQATNSSSTALAADDEAMAQAAVLVDSIAVPMTMQAASELGLLDIIAGAGQGAQLTAAEVAEKLPVQENPQAADMVDRILRLLVAFSMVTCSLEADGAGGGTRRVYGLTPVGKYFVKDQDGVSMAPLMRLINDKVFVDS